MPAARADDEHARAEEARALTEWLTQAGLDGLLAVALEEELRQAPRSSPATVARLAEAYVRMLAVASDQEQLDDLRARIAKFLSREGRADEMELRIALSRAQYRIAIREIDRVRGGDRGSEAAARASALLAQAREPLAQYITTLESRVDDERRLATGADEAQRQESELRRERYEQQLVQARFLRNWCDYWDLWLTRPGGPCAERKPALREAMLQEEIRQWSEILETGLPYPEPEHASVDLRSEEYYAQSILGMALTKALKGPFAISEGWFDLLAQEGSWSGLRDCAQWKYGARIDAGEYEAAQAMLSDPACTLRPIDAVGGALRAAVQSRDADGAVALARRALEYAAEHGDVASANRVASGLPVLAEGDSFVAHLCRGIAAYERGRAAAERGKAREAFASAATELAVAAQLAVAGSKALPAISEFLAWSQLGAQQYCDAADSFEAAAAARSGARADEALWMALRSADLGGCPSKERPGEHRCNELAARYLRENPEGSHAAEALAILARAPDAFRDGQLVESVLRLAASESERSPLRETAATLVYRRFRSASGDDRRVEAMRLLALPTIPASAWPAGTISLVVRQQLEAALDPSVRALDEARRLLAEVATRYARRDEPPETRSEIAVRRLNLALEERNITASLRALDDVRELGDATWRSVAESLFVAGVQRMDAEGSLPKDGDPAISHALSLAKRALREAAQRQGDASRADAASIALGRALLEEARTLRAAAGAGDAAARDAAAALDGEALALAAETLAHRPDDASAISLQADAAMALGKFDEAFAALARLVGGLPERSDEWFTRKADLCELLARTDPSEARRALAQHAVLVPEWGPGGGGARLKALAERLGVLPSTSPGAKP